MSGLQSPGVACERRRGAATACVRARRLLWPVRWVACEASKAWECFDAATRKDCATESREDDMPDVTAGKDHDAVEAAVDRLLHALKAAERQP